MEKYCPTCRRANEEDSRFCAFCGTPLDAQAAPRPAAPTDPTQPYPILGAGPGAPPAPISGAPGLPPAWSPPPPGSAAPELPYPAAPAWSPPPAGSAAANGPYPAESIWGPPPPGAGRPAADLPRPPPAAWTPLPATAPLPPPPTGSITPAPPRRPNWWAVAAVAAGGGLLIVALLVLAVVSLVRNTAAPRPSVTVRLTPGTESGTPAGTALDAEIRAAVEASNQAQIAVLRTLDPSKMDGAVLGQARQDNLDLLNTLQQRGLYAESQLVDIVYQPARLIDADHATIRTRESWTTTYYRSSDKRMVNRSNETGLDETYYLTRQNGKWIVERVDIQSPNTAPSTPDDTQ